MSDIRIKSKTPATPAPAKGPVTQAPKATLTTKAATDSLQTTAVPKAPVNDPKAVIEEAVAIPPMPTSAPAERTWLLDGYKRLLKADVALQAVRKEWSAGKIDANTYSMATAKVAGLERQLKKAPQHDAVKSEFFEGIKVPAQALLDDLSRVPEPPKDKAGKAKWLAEGKLKVEQAKAAENIIRDAWLRYDAAPFDELRESGRDRFDFEMRLWHVERELETPAKPKAGEKGKANPGRPLFELTQAAQKGVDSKNPVGQAVGAVAMPIALTLDVIDMITRPFQWMDSLKK